MPTLPATGASARTTYTGSKLTLRISEWASANPASDSRIASCGSLISFFMCAPPISRGDGITATRNRALRIDNVGVVNFTDSALKQRRSATANHDDQTMTNVIVAQ